MAYTLDFSLALGGSKTSLTLNAQLVDTSGTNSGAAISTGFAEIGNGYYLWHYAAFADAFRGGVKFYESGVPGTILAFAAINPEEAENTDVKTSTRSDGTGVTLADDAITAAKYDETTAFPVTSADTGATQIARVGADGDTLETLSDQIDGAATAAGVWSYTTRTLTQSAASVTSSVTGTDITLTKADSFSASLTGLASNSGYTSIWFTVKDDLDDADSAAVFQIKKNASGSGDGLLYVNGAAASNAALGSITVDSATALTIALDESITDDLTVTQGLYYSIKYLVSGSTSTVTSGQLDVVQYSTKAIV